MSYFVDLNFPQYKRDDFRTSQCSCIKVKNNLSPPLIELFSQKEQHYEMHNEDFDLSRCKTVRYGKHSFRYFGPCLWSKLNLEDGELSSLKSFKCNIRKKNLVKIIEDVCGNCRLF